MSNLATVKVFTDLIVWQKSHEFVLGVYKSKENFPKAEIYGLTSQFRRAAVSIAANIAECFSKRGKVDKARYLQYCSRFYREMSLLPHSCPRFKFWRKHTFISKAGGSQQILDVIIKPLLTSDF